jgi:hypothetical protein
MALMNNWDLKDDNNAVYLEKHKGGLPEQVYLVSDLGASFGTTGYTLSVENSRGNLEAYKRSKFITKPSHDKVDFETAARRWSKHLTCRCSSTAWIYVGSAETSLALTPNGWDSCWGDSLLSRFGMRFAPPVILSRTRMTSRR